MTRIVLALSLLVLASSGAALASGPQAAAAGTCRLTLDQQRHSGATYLVQLKQSGTTCPAALKFEKAWQTCRRSTAGHMTCRKRVLGYTSSQKVLDSSKTQYDAKVSAKNGSRSVTFIYTQNK